MKQAIALAGGGTKGAYQVGAWKAMRELGIPFDIVTGTSIGSVTAALMVQGDFDRAWELWTHITEDQTNLVAQADHPVQWIQCVRTMQDFGADTFVEAGPGKTLCGFNKRIDRSLKSMNVENIETLEKTLDYLREVR